MKQEYVENDEIVREENFEQSCSLDLSEIEAVNLKAENDEFDLATDLQEACVNSKLKLIFNKNSSKAQGAQSLKTPIKKSEKVKQPVTKK